MKSAQSKFNSKLRRKGEHLLWTGAVTAAGVGVVRIEGSLRTVRRAAWEFAHGSVPDGMRVRACSDEKLCVRVEHLRLNGEPQRIQSIPKETRSRRRADDARDLILQAGGEIFKELGYAATRTRDVAKRAGYSEPVLFRHFATKAELFDAALVEPFSRIIDDHVRSWADPAESAELSVHRIIAGLYDLLRQHRKLALTLIGAHSAGESDPLWSIASTVSRRVWAMLSATQPLAAAQSKQRGNRPLDAPVTVAACFGMIFSMALLDDWLLPAGAATPSRDRQIAELTQMALYGLGLSKS